MKYIYFIATYLVLLNIVTTYRLLKIEDYKVTQKIIQFILLWTIPLIGVLIVSLFLNQEPIVLSKKMQKYKIILKILLFPWLIKIESNGGKDIGNSVAGYQADSSSTSGGD
ncbi:hypothetical protein [Sulfurimonas sp.]|uniref:hypothetical protein n=1 Tax=Sulfurimonas sp. TaxID=2022749 RepID=UPI0025DF59CE|nr:hypothetical protein [Sulfurimonas sp.]